MTKNWFIYGVIPPLFWVVCNKNDAFIYLFFHFLWRCKFSRNLGISVTHVARVASGRRLRGKSIPSPPCDSPGLRLLVDRRARTQYSSARGFGRMTQHSGYIHRADELSAIAWPFHMFYLLLCTYIHGFIISLLKPPKNDDGVQEPRGAVVAPGFFSSCSCPVDDTFTLSLSSFWKYGSAPPRDWAQGGWSVRARTTQWLIISWWPDKLPRHRRKMSLVIRR